MSKDIDELTMLNRDYVNSVQNSDVKRFSEILAGDFYCSNPDKSLVDRAAFPDETVWSGYGRGYFFVPLVLPVLGLALLLRRGQKSPPKSPPPKSPPPSP